MSCSAAAVYQTRSTDFPVESCMHGVHQGNKHYVFITQCRCTLHVQLHQQASCCGAACLQALQVNMSAATKHKASSVALSKHDDRHSCIKMTSTTHSSKQLCTLYTVATNTRCLLQRP